MKRLTKTNSTPDNEIIARRLREGLFILACAMALYLLIALATYNTADPGWSRSTAANVIKNSGGLIGAWSSDVLLNFFGYVAYIFPLLLTLAGMLLFKNYPIKQHKMLLRILHIFGFICIVAGSCALVSMVFPYKFSSNIPGPSGGIIGSLLTKWLAVKLNTSGSILIFSAMLLIGITLATGVSWVKLIEAVGKYTIIVMLRAASGLSYAGQQIYIAIHQAWKKLLTRNAAPRIKNLIRTEFEAEVPKIEPTLKAAVRAAARTPLIAAELEIKNPPVLSKIATVRQKFTTSSKSLRNNKLPELDLLDAAEITDPKKHYSVAVLEKLSREVEQRLLDFGAEVKVVAVCPGPIITRFEMTLAPGLKVSKISGLAKDLARSLSVTSVRVVEVIPGKAVVGLEIPNKYRETVKLRDVLESPQYQDKDGPLNLALGKDISGVPVVVNLAQMPHLLVAGTTGSGKSVGVNAMLLSLLYKATPADLRLILIDPKMLELSVYDGIGHLLTPVVTDMNDAANALRWCVAEMERRYQVMATMGVRNLAGFNAKVIQAEIDGKPLPDPLWDANSGTPQRHLEKLPYIVVIIDEFADMMMVVGKKVEELIARIAQKARAAGIHMILATQRPSVDVITGLIKANIPTRIAFQVSSRIDSRTILDQQGAEQLLGYGDMLYLAPGTGIPVRVHGAFVSDQEVHKVVEAIKQSIPAPDYSEDIASSNIAPIPGIDAMPEPDGEQDPLYDQAVAIVVESRKASISYLQRRLKIGYNRSARLIEAMEAAGLVSEMQHNGSREVL
jgi:S-DNA-T family DNA segregation ATPase FtsK/SpoIIIE